MWYATPKAGYPPGVTVTAVSPSVPGTHISVTESDGQYRLLNLPPGVFDVVAELAGFTKYMRQGVEVRAGLNLTLDIVLTLGSVVENVIVSGDSPLLETQKPIQAVNIAGDLLRVSRTPLAARGSFRRQPWRNGTRESAGGSRSATAGSRSLSVS